MLSWKINQRLLTRSQSRIQQLDSNCWSRVAQVGVWPSLCLLGSLPAGSFFESPVLPQSVHLTRLTLSLSPSLVSRICNLRLKTTASCLPRPISSKKLPSTSLVISHMADLRMVSITTESWVWNVRRTESDILLRPIHLHKVDLARRNPNQHESGCHTHSHTLVVLLSDSAYWSGVVNLAVPIMTSSPEMFGFDTWRVSSAPSLTSFPSYLGARANSVLCCSVKLPALPKPQRRVGVVF